MHLVEAVRLRIVVLVRVVRPSRLLTRPVALGSVLSMNVSDGARPTLARWLILECSMFPVDLSVRVADLCLLLLLRMAQNIAVLCRLVAICVLAMATKFSCGLPICTLSALVMTIPT